MNGCFVSGYTKPFVPGQLWVGVGRESRHTQPHSPRKVTRQRVHAGHRPEAALSLEPGAVGLLQRKRGCCSGGPSPEVSQSSVCVTSPGRPSLFPQHPSSLPTLQFGMRNPPCLGSLQ